MAPAAAACAPGAKPTRAAVTDARQPGIGIFTGAAATALAAAGPWRSLAAAPRRAGWRALEAGAYTRSFFGSK